MIITELHCNKCGETKPINNFHARPSKKSGYRYPCKLCIKKDMYKWRENNPERSANINKRSNLAKHHVSIDRYNNMRYLQDYCCSICGTDEDELGYLLYIDHDHTCCKGLWSCGKCVRTLLCNPCNVRRGA